MICFSDLNVRHNVKGAAFVQVIHHLLIFYAHGGRRTSKIHPGLTLARAASETLKNLTEVENCKSQTRECVE